LAPSEHFVHRGQANFKPLVEQGDIETTIENWTHDPYWIAPGNDHAGQLFQMLLSSHPQNISHLSHFAQNMDPPILSRLSEIDVPTLLITGESDHPDIHAHAGAIQAGIAQAQRIVFPRAGHLVHMERPDAFNRLVDAFIKTVFTG
jgi:pimeloyl-ACP methyl ester carboxylesterase